MLICDIATVGPAVHAWHLALHLGLATVVSMGGALFLAIGVRAHRRTMQEIALEAASSSIGADSRRSLAQGFRIAEGSRLAEGSERA